MSESTDKVDEQQLDEYLKGDSSVSRQYRQLPGADVPPSLDRLVLRQAEQALQRPSRPAWMRWTAPLAVAATAVLVVSIVIESGVQEKTMISIPAQMKRAAEAPAETRMIEESASEPSASAPAQDLGVAQADMPAPQAPEIVVPPPVSAEQPLVAAEGRPAPPPVAAPAPAPREEQVAKAEQRDDAEYISDAWRQKSSLEAAAREQELSQAQGAGPRGTVEMPEPKAVLSYSRAISVPADNPASLQKTHTDPEAWLKEIRQLRQENKHEEADRQWRRFLETFPNYEVAETDSARETKR